MVMASSDGFTSRARTEDRMHMTVLDHDSSEPTPKFKTFDVDIEA